MGPLMKTASIKPEVALLDSEWPLVASSSAVCVCVCGGSAQLSFLHGRSFSAQDMENMSEEDGWEFVNLGDQQSFGIKTAGLEEKATACQMLVSGPSATNGDLT